MFNIIHVLYIKIYTFVFWAFSNVASVVATHT